VAISRSFLVSNHLTCWIEGEPNKLDDKAAVPMSLLLLGIRINEAVTEMGPKNAGSRFRVEMWCSLWALAAPQKHTFDAGADDSAVQPLLSALVEAEVPPDSVPNAYPRSSPSRCLRLSLSLNRRRTLRKGKILIRLLLYAFLGVT